MIKHKDSHLDHGLTPAQVEHVFALFVGRTGFFIETIELPESLGAVLCALFGPVMGDAPVTEDEVTYGVRGTRAWFSRIVQRNGIRTTRKVTVIAGPHDGQPCVLYTAFGGPPTPQEPADPGCKDVEASTKFWSEHALVNHTP
jgi:hypothetical protein